MGVAMLRTPRASHHEGRNGKPQTQGEAQRETANPSSGDWMPVLTVCAESVYHSFLSLGIYSLKTVPCSGHSYGDSQT